MTVHGPQPTAGATVELYDLHLRKVMTAHVSPGTNGPDLKAMPEDNYLLWAKDGNGQTLGMEQLVVMT